MHQRLTYGLLTAGLALVVACIGGTAINHGGMQPVLATSVVGRVPVVVAVDEATGRVFVANRASHDVSVLDASTGRVLRTIPLGNDPYTIAHFTWPLSPIVLAVDTRTARVYVGSEESRALAVLDATSGRLLRTTAVLEWPLILAAPTPLGRIFALGLGASHDSGFSALDATSGRLRWSVTFDRQAGIFAHYHGGALAVDTRTGRAFVASMSRTCNCVHVLDARTGAVLRTVSVGSPGRNPVAAAVDVRADRAFVVNDVDNRVITLDARTGSVVHTTTVRTLPTAVAVDQQDGRVFVVSRGPSDRAGNPLGKGTVSVLDAHNGAVLHTVTVGRWPLAVAVDARRHRVFVVNANIQGGAHAVETPGSVSVLAARTGRLLHTISVGMDPLAIAVDEQTDRVFVVNSASASQPDPWQWIPGWVRRWVPLIPPRQVDTTRGSVSMLDAAY